MKKEFFNILKVYLFTSVFIFIIILFNTSFFRTLELFYAIITTKRGLVFFHISLIITYCLFLILRYFKRIFKRKGAKIMLKQLSLRLTLPIMLLIFSFKFILHKNSQENFDFNWDYSVENTCGYSNNLFENDGKHRGMSLYRLGRNNNSQIDHLVKTNIEWVSLFPYFYQKDEQSKTANVPEQIGQWTSRDSTFINDIKTLQEKGIHIMLKPHLWMSDGWRANIKMGTEEEWNTWFKSYRENICIMRQWLK